MSTIGTRRSEASSGLAQDDAHAGQTAAAVTPPPAKTPYWLLWSTGIAAFVLSVIAFVLWGISGASTLFDMIVAFCS